MSWKRFLAMLVLAFFVAGPVFATMSSSNYQVQWDAFSEGGNETGSSTNYAVHDAIGGFAAGSSTSANYTTLAGYRGPEGVPTLSFVFRMQDSNVSIAYTAFNNSARTVTVATTTGLSIGDYLAIVENRGLSQRVAVARIMDRDGLLLYLDSLGGANATISSSPSDLDDFVYRLGSASMSFGNIAADIAYTAVGMTSVLSSVTSGYTVYVQADHALQTTGGQTITPVSDGTVSIGSEEYGLSTTGTRAVNGSTDFAITNSQQSIQSSGSPTTSGPERSGLIYKMVITAITNAGAYSQNTYYTLTANY